MKLPTFFIVTAILLNLSCASSQLQYEKTSELKINKEFESAVTIQRPPEPTSSVIVPVANVTTPSTHKQPPLSKRRIDPPRKTEIKRGAIEESDPSDIRQEKSAPKSEKKASLKSKSKEPPAPLVRQPDLESTDGFAPGSRRPLVDPFRVGEEVVHDVSYFKVSAGTLRLKVEPFVTVNGKRSYTFAIEIGTSALFNAFYSVDDRAETFVDFDSLVPSVFQLHVKESGQLREAKMLFDHDKNKATFWEKKVTKQDGEEEKRQEWEILPFSQNVYSAVFYMRLFKWEPGQEYSFRVANDKENLVFSGKALRREVLDTKLGPLKAIVIQPNIVLKGKFKPIGDNFIWLSDDEHRYILRIESKIRIGTLVSEVVAIHPGKN